ncbi:TIGR03086 family metal-binding protein [Rhodococcus tukisamuensis]|uniref:TIGR03086 family protein n=1 Tax=Rhodococcus tukisamuensis TaxID=168276 RepID=A0A1G6MG38_9NOCA|nr:TIGR03086 family metal-binding protein [Rhodococcus tukisamuensis]SDC54224.1 TIGR03086 family protein [Rhodococcus tukisamuensis]
MTVSRRVAWPVADPVALLERAISYALGSLQLVTAQDMSAPTPCREWNLRELLAHMNDALEALQEAVDDRVVALVPDEGPPNISSDPVAALRDRACHLLGSWTGSADPAPIRIGEVPVLSDIVPSAGALEVAVHGWDVSVACGNPRPIPAALADELLSCAALFVTDADRPARFGVPVESARDAGPGDRLLAFLGRDPSGRGTR